MLVVAALSGVVNMLVLTSSIYMLQVYDRAIPSGSIETLIGLSAGALLLYGFQGMLDVVRQRIMTRLGAAFDLKIGPRAYGLVSRTAVYAGRSGPGGVHSLRDLETVRGFLGGLGPTILFDLPWLPIYLAVCFAFHPLLGAVSLVGAALLWGLAIATEMVSRAPAKAAAAEAISRAAFADNARHNAEAVAAMGMRANLTRLFHNAQLSQNVAQIKAHDTALALNTMSRTARMVLQSAILGTGAVLVINGDASSGVMIAASIMMGRALAPIELAIAHWRPFLAARDAWKRLDQALAGMPPEDSPLPLPPPRRELAIENLAVATPGQADPLVQGVTLRLEAGDGLAVIGPSGSGKTTLIRAVAGIWPSVRGKVRLDGSALDHFGEAGRGKAIGYLPQDVELMEGTVTDNIARFAADPDPEAVVAAAEAAGAHRLVASLPQGYQTRVGEGGARLSAGQRQRIGLARALYGEPFLVVLDEPNSNLDAEGEAALTAALRQVRARGGIAVVVAHRPSAITALDKVLVMAQGRVHAFGPKQDIMPKILVPAGASPMHDGAETPDKAALGGEARP